MISKRYDITLNNGEAPYSYEMYSDSSCVSFLSGTGVTDNTGKFSPTVRWTSPSCIDTAVIGVRGVDENGCEFDIELTLDDPCDILSVNPIFASDNFTFSVSASSPSSTLSFEWTYDTGIFDLNSKSDGTHTSTITLSPKSSSSYPASSQVSVTVRDSNGCFETVSTVTEICVPTALDIEVNLYEQGTGPTSVFEGPTFNLRPLTGCSDIQTDYCSLSVNTPSSVDFLHLTPSNTLGADCTTFQVTVPRSVYDNDGPVLIFPYTLETTDGRRSNTANIIVRLNTNAGEKTIVGLNTSYRLDCNATPGDVVEIPINLTTTPGTVIDWSSWQLVQPPTPKSSSISLATTLDGDRVLRYTVPNPVEQDVFSWSIADTNGNYATAITTTVINCANPPVANDDSITLGCNSQGTFDILSNDVGTAPLDISSVSIVTFPSSVSLSVNSNGTVTISTAGITEEITDSFTYTVDDINGSTSNVATVSINVPCSGTDAVVALCN